VPAHSSYDYAVVRVVPRVERAEFINVGVIVCCAAEDFLQCRIELDTQRLRALDPGVSIDSVQSYLAVIPRICTGGAAAGPIGQLSVRERFDWLVAPRSTIIQVSPVHTGQCRNLAATAEHLMDAMVRPVRT